MFASLKNSLMDWFYDSKLEGLYIVGSYSLGEQNTNSDVDFIGISKNVLNKEEVISLQSLLKNQLKDILNPEQIGFRIRAFEDLDKFQLKLKSWGYDLHDAQRLFGVELNEILKPSADVPFCRKEILDNLLEKEWYDLLFIQTTDDQSRINYLSAKTILDLLSFILYFNGIFVSKNRDRIEFLKKNIFLIDSLPITINDFIDALKVKTNPDSYQSEIKLFEKRLNLLKAIYSQYLPEFKKMESEYSELDYWSYDATLFRPLKEILINDTPLDRCRNPNFVWRETLFHLFIDLDYLRLETENSITYFLQKGKIESVFGVDYLNHNDDSPKSLLSLLKNLEAIRIATSNNGKDVTKNILNT